MFNHRNKTIGKSVYSIVNLGGYFITEIYNERVIARSKYTHQTIDEALQELESIRCEQYYTDASLRSLY